MMKSFYKVFIVLLLSTLSFFSVAQSGYIDSLFILPQAPTSTSQISVVCHSYFTVQPSSIQEHGDLTFFDIFPNPVTLLLNITLLNNQTGSCTIYDISGNLLQSQSLRDINNQFNVSHLSKGIYFIEVKTPTHSGVKKFIKH